MISNEYGMSCDLQSAIALYVAEKLCVKVKDSDDIESIDDSYTSVSCWDLKPAYRSLSNKAVEYIVEGMISQILYKNFFGCRFAVNARVVRLGRSDAYPEEPDYSISVSIALGGEKIW